MSADRFLNLWRIRSLPPTMAYSNLLRNRLSNLCGFACRAKWNWKGEEGIEDDDEDQEGDYSEGAAARPPNRSPFNQNIKIYLEGGVGVGADAEIVVKYSLRQLVDNLNLLLVLVCPRARLLVGRDLNCTRKKRKKEKEKKRRRARKRQRERQRETERERERERARRVTASTTALSFSPSSSSFCSSFFFFRVAWETYWTSGPCALLPRPGTAITAFGWKCPRCSHRQT